MSKRPPLPLTGKVALVTGGSRGLGRALARGLAGAGADLVIASRDGDACERYAAEIRELTGQRALGLAVHVGHWDELSNVVDAAIDRLGGIDVLINNAGMSPLYDDLVGVSEALFDKVVDVNLKGPFRLSALVGQHMVESGGGSIINVSSAASLRPRPHLLPYAAAKAGVNALTIGFAHAFGPTVRVNAILAGTFRTDVSTSWDEDVLAARVKTFAAGRVGEPAELIGMAVYLASDASSYTTGALLAVDGGQP